MTCPSDTSPGTSSLQAAFLDDHRRLTRGLTELMSALQVEDDACAARLAALLDRDVGAHIEFEEEHFYPALVPILGGEFVQQLYREHCAGRSALERLAMLAPDARLALPEREKVVRWVEEIQAHAESCGTLVSHLASLDAERQRELLEHLLAARRRGRRWTDRPAARDGSRGGE